MLCLPLSCQGLTSQESRKALWNEGSLFLKTNRILLMQGTTGQAQSLNQWHCAQGE